MLAADFLSATNSARPRLRIEQSTFAAGKTIFGRNSVRMDLLGKLNRIKPISYFKANASEILRDLEEAREPLIITQNGEAKAVVQAVASYEQAQETLALLKILALGRAEAESAKSVSLQDVRRRFESKRKA